MSIGILPLLRVLCGQGTVFLYFPGICSGFTIFFRYSAVFNRAMFCTLITRICWLIAQWGCRFRVSLIREILYIFCIFKPFCKLSDYVIEIPYNSFSLEVRIQNYRRVSRKSNSSLECLNISFILFESFNESHFQNSLFVNKVKIWLKFL